MIINKWFKSIFLKNLQDFNISEFESNHRPHQKEALLKLQNDNIGQVSIPTGTGKTRIQLALHIQDMIAKTKQNQYGVYVITAHRLALCNQLFNDFVIQAKFISKLDCNFLSVSSESYSLKRLHKSIIKRNKNLSSKVISEILSHDHIEVSSTTSSDEIKRFIDKSKKSRKHCVIIATYDSFDRLNKLNAIDVCTYDEAHEITREDYFDNVEKIKPLIKRQFFFTATRKESDCKRGMNHIDFYGPVLFEKSPREMIELGEIIRPNNYHEIKVSNDEGYNYDNPIMTIRAVTEGFIQHRVKVKSKEFSYNPSKIGAKLLVTCDGTKQLIDIVEDANFKKWALENKIRIFSLNSEHGEWCDFKKINNRNLIIDLMNDLSDNEDAIFFHVDILAEGIDLPAITGIMPLRDMPAYKLTQTLGRATRLLQEDRRRLYLDKNDKEKIYFHETEKFIKPYAWVLIAPFLLEDPQRMINVINRVYDEYGLKAERFSMTEQFMANADHSIPSMNSDEEMMKRFKEGELVHEFKLSDLLKQAKVNKIELFKETLRKYDA